MLVGKRMAKNMVCNAKGEIASNEKFTRTHDARAIPKSELRQNDKTGTGFASESSGKNKLSLSLSFSSRSRWDSANAAHRNRNESRMPNTDHYHKYLSSLHLQYLRLPLHFRLLTLPREKNDGLMGSHMWLHLLCDCTAFLRSQRRKMKERSDTAARRKRGALFRDKCEQHCDRKLINWHTDLLSLQENTRHDEKTTTNW